MLGPAMYESARLPFRIELPSTNRSRGTSATKSELYETLKRTPSVPIDEADGQHVREREHVERVRQRERAEGDRAAEIGRDHHLTLAAAAVDPGAGMEGEEKVRCQLDGEEVAHLSRRGVQHQDCDQRQRDHADLVAEQRDRLTEPEAPEARVLAQERWDQHRRRTLVVPRAMPAFVALIAVTAGLGRDVRAGEGRGRALSAVRVPGRPLRDRFDGARRPGRQRLRSLGRPGWVAGSSLGLLLATGYALQTAGLQRTTVSSAGFITGLYVVFTPLLALSLFRTRVGGAVWVGVALAVVGLAMLSGVGAGDPLGDLLVLLASAAYSLQIVLMERYAPRYDPVAFTQAELLAAFAGFAVVAVALGQVEVPRGWTVWGALLVTGIFASALAFLVQTWAQRRTSATRTALAFAMEPVWAGDLRLLARRRPARRGRLGRLCGDHGRDRRRRARGGRTLRRLVARA